LINIEPLFTNISKHVDLTDGERKTIAEHVRLHKYLKGQFVVQQGDVCRYESFVLSGCLKTFYVDPGGQEHIVMFGIENWWASDMCSFISQTPADFNVQCIEDTELAQFSFDNLDKLYRQVPKLERFFRIIIQNALIASEKRIVRNHCLPAKERYLKFRERYPQIEQRVPQYMIASYLGITKEFLSKIRSQLIAGQ
jgi:CRP-like cAMP-binding protein